AREPLRRPGRRHRGLEDFLHIPSGTGFAFTEEHLTALEDSVQKFNSAPAARLRSLVFLGLFGVCGLVGLLAMLLGWFSLTAGLANLATAAGLTYFVTQGIFDKTYLFLKVREFARGASVGDWAAWLGGTAVLVIVLLLLGLLWTCLAFAAFGGIVG